MLVLSAVFKHQAYGSNHIISIGSGAADDFQRAIERLRQARFMSLIDQACCQKCNAKAGL